MVRVWPADRAGRGLERAIVDCFYLGSHRTPAQDVEFAIAQLSEIAVRALSPGINDPFTAVSCIDRLASGLAHIATREMEGPTMLPPERRQRLVTDRTTFDGLMAAAFDQIRQHGRSQPAIMIRLLEAIQRIAVEASTRHQRASLRRHADLVLHDGLDGIPNPADREDLRRRYDGTLARLDGRQEDSKPAG